MVARDAPANPARLSHELQQRVRYSSLSPFEHEVDTLSHQHRLRCPQLECKPIEPAILCLA